MRLFLSAVAAVHCLATTVSAEVRLTPTEGFPMVTDAETEATDSKDVVAQADGGPSEPQLDPSQPEAMDPDLALIRQRIADRPEWRRIFGEVAVVSNPNDLAAQIRQGVQGMIGEELLYGDTPFNVRAAEQAPLAAERARFVQRVLSADLDGDWVVTLTEVRSMLSTEPGQGTAEAVLVADADGDGRVTFDELRAAAAAQPTQAVGGRRAATQVLVIFDFDEDGIVTDEERVRGRTAIGL